MWAERIGRSPLEDVDDLLEEPPDRALDPFGIVQCAVPGDPDP
jgi:hypothetical protein